MGAAPRFETQRWNHNAKDGSEQYEMPEDTASAPVWRKEWTWSHDRDVKASGKTLETRWPAAAELRPAKALPKGEQERTSRDASYTVVLQGEGHPPVTYSPETLEELQRFAIGSTHTLQQENGEVSVVPPKQPPPAPAK
ncbi:hypothetical protein [Pyxidicoccus trucidator]|uniref:hypothetical protein n=1 Tax=Pyxidicoccus trucidator TaxID=2709662 RepID=UPI001F07B74F|nr:hypothetical protein [Pyxidicoccus trucidator]